MFGIHRLRLLIGAAAAVGVVAFAVHAGAQAPSPGKYISWAAPATATATPGAGPALPVASAAPAVDSGPLGGLTAALGTVQAAEHQHRGDGDRSVLADLRTSKPRWQAAFSSS